MAWIYRALTFLVISCPCALVISIPLSFFGGIGGASKSGVLVKGSNYLEILANTEIVVFDKTGTLTKGSFAVQIYKTTPDAEVLRPWIWRCLNKRTSNRYNLLINTDKKGKKQAHQMKFYQKYFTSCFNPRRILSRTRLGSTPSTSAISFTVIPR